MRLIKRSLVELAVACAIGAIPFSSLAASRIDAELSAEWWEWAVSIPNSASPILDTTGAECMVGQKGHIWFLAGTNGTSASRTCQIPEGDALFFPVVNAVNFDSPGVCGQVGHLSVHELRQFSAAFIDGITSYGATLDGASLSSIRRIRSVVFPLALPADNYFNVGTCVIPSAVYARSVDDGYYASVDFLKPGVHTLVFQAANDAGFSVNVTYEITVVRGDRHER